MHHPGRVIQEKLEYAGMSRKELAIRTGVTEKHICTIVNGDKNISASFAKKLGYVFETAEYWLDIQSRFDAEQLSIKEENSISEDELALIKNLQEILGFLIERGYLHNDCGDPSKVLQLREFLQISDLTQIPKITYNAAYRAQLSKNIKVDPYVLFAWQHLCEKEVESIRASNFIDKAMLRKSIPDIKELMFKDINDGIESLQRILSKCGIAFQVVRNFKGAPVQGFIKETKDKGLILCLTIRGKRADRFWFTLFHEIAHIINGDYKQRFVDFDSVQCKAEELADQAARDFLIDPDSYRDFIMSNNEFPWAVIQAFAEAMNVKPFIVLGRLQNDGFLEWSDYTDKVVRYSWA